MARGRLLGRLDELGVADDTIVIYTSDQGFFLGDHGWFDKRLMDEESLTMPFLIRYPRLIEAGSVNDDVVVNVGFARTILAMTPADPPEWELYDLAADPFEVANRIADPALAEIRAELWRELCRLQAEVGDEPHPAVAGGPPG